MSEFHFQVQFKDYELSEESHYSVECKRDPTYENTEFQADTLDQILTKFTEKPEAIKTQRLFDELYSFVKRISKLKMDTKKALVSALVKGVEMITDKQNIARALNAASQDIIDYRSAVRMYTVLISQVISECERAASERGTKRQRKNAGHQDTVEEYDWSSDRERLVGALSNMLSVQHIKQFWPMNQPEEAYGIRFWKSAEYILERASCQNSSETLGTLEEMMVRTVTNYNVGPITVCGIVRVLQSCSWNKEERLAAVVARVIHKLYEQQHTSFLDEIIEDVNGCEFNHKQHEGKGAKCVSFLYSELASLMPREMMNKMESIVRLHLSRDNMYMRQSVVRMVGEILLHLKSRANETPEAFFKLRGTMFEIIIERCLDKVGLVRKLCITTLARLLQMNKLSYRELSHYNIMDTITDRIHDKNIYVRKASMLFFDLLIKNWPFKPENFNLQQNLKFLEETRKAEKELIDKFSKEQLNHIESLIEKSEKDAQKENLEPMAVESGIDALNGKNHRLDEEEKEPILPDFSNVPQVNIKEVQQKLSNLRAQKEFFSRSIFFLQKLEKAFKKATSLLSSRNKYDVQTAIALFKTSSDSTMLDKAMRSVEEAYKQMLTLVWDKDNSDIRKAVLMAYYNKYFVTVQYAPKQPGFALNAAKRLVELTTNATLSSITCIEELVRLMTPTASKPERAPEKKDASPTIPLSVFKALWHIFETDRDIDKKRGALDLLRMAAKACPQIISEKVKEIVEIGLGPLASEDEFLARSSFLALSCIPKEYRENGLLPPDLERKIWKRVAKLLHGGFVDSKNWFAAAEMAIRLVFSFHDKPHKVSQKIIRSVAEQLWSMGSPPTEYPCSMPIPEMGGQLSDIPILPETQPLPGGKSASGKPEEGNSTTQPIADNATLTSQATEAQTQSTQPAIREKYVIAPLEMKNYRLAKLFFLLGHIAIKMLVFIEEKEHELKQKRRAQQRAKEQLKQQKMKNRGMEKGDAAVEIKEDDEADLEAQFGMEGSAEHEMEEMRSTAEKSLVSRSTLLGSFVRVIKYVIMNQSKFKSNLLQNSAVLALCKFMCIDDSFCRKNLRLLFTLLKGSSANPSNPDIAPNIRANIIIALGDMAFRFPNSMDTWNKDIYEHLRDSNIMVKKNTLMVLTHLILNDMIKVKDSIADIALLIEDPSSEIADLARLFFQELGKKGNKRKNPIYNILPDTISRLSDKKRKVAVSDRVFENVMKFLMEFVDGEKQKVNLVERLCKRFSTSTDLQMYRRTAFCIAQISFSPAVTRKIVDDQTTKKYLKRLGDKHVWDYFKIIIGKARKFVTDQFKATFDGWENKLREANLTFADMQAAAERGERMANRAKRKFGDLSDIEEEDVMEVEMEEKRKDTFEHGSANGEPAEKKQAVMDPSAPEVGLPIPKPLSSKRSKARRNAKKRIVDSSSSEDDSSDTSEDSDSSEESEASESEVQPRRGRRKFVRKKQPQKKKLKKQSKLVKKKQIQKGKKQQVRKNAQSRRSTMTKRKASTIKAKRKPQGNKGRGRRKGKNVLSSSEPESEEDSDVDSDLEVTEDSSSEEESS